MHCQGSPWDQNIKAKAVGAIFKAVVEGPEALMGVYACHEKAISSVILKSPPAEMTLVNWVHPQDADPTINQEVAWMKSEKLDTVKMSDEMSQELRQYLRHWEKMCL